MILRVEASFSGGDKGGLLVNLGDFAVELIEDGAQGAGQSIVLVHQCRPMRTQDAEMQLGVKERDLQAIAGRGIAVSLGDAVNETFEAKAAEVVGHLRGGVGTTEERLDLRAEVAVVKAAREMREASESLEDRHHPRIAETKRGGPLPGFDRRLLQAVEGVLRQD